MKLDYSVSTWQELGTLAFFSALVGMVLAIGLYMAVVML